MENDFETFLNNEKNNFCKFHCKYNNLNIIDVEINEEFECYSCDNTRTIEYTEEINLCQDHCPLDGFIKEIRDKNITKIIV